MGKVKNRIYSLLSSTTNIEKAKKNGLKIGENPFIGAGTYIDPSHCFLISIGNNVTISSKVHILAHDASTKLHLGYTKIGQVKIEDNVFIGACSVIMPGICIGKNSIIGAGSVVTQNIPSGEVWAGTPAKKISTTNEYLSKYNNIKIRFNKNYRIGTITDEQKKEMIKATEEGVCFIE